jgi:hypothetical protein
VQELVDVGARARHCWQQELGHLRPVAGRHVRRDGVTDTNIYLSNLYFKPNLIIVIIRGVSPAPLLSVRELRDSLRFD